MEVPELELTNVRINCDLNLSIGDVSCDIVVLGIGNKLYNFLACNSTSDLVLKCSENYSMTECTEFNPLEIAAVVSWANLRYKMPNMMRHSEVVDANTGDRSSPQEFVLSLMDFDACHPSGLPKFCIGDTLNVAEVLTTFTDLYCFSTRTDANTISFNSNKGNNLIYCWTCTTDRTRFEIPYPVAVGEKTINSTIIMVGNGFKCAFEHSAADFVTEILDDTQDAPTCVKRLYQNGLSLQDHLSDPRYSKISYRGAERVPCTRGLHSYYNGGDKRMSVYTNGVEVTDLTSKRLVMTNEMHNLVIPFVCGCLLSNALKFPRANIPFVLSSEHCKKVVFEDDDLSNRVKMVLTDARNQTNTFYIDTTTRTSFKNLLWLKIEL